MVKVFPCGVFGPEYIRELRGPFDHIPLVAVGFMYPQGYLKQKIQEDGWQENISEPLDQEAASISRVLNEDETQLVVKVPFIEPAIHVAVWQDCPKTLPVLPAACGPVKWDRPLTLVALPCV